MPPQNSMDKKVEEKLNNQIAEFKNVAWRDAVEELRLYLDLSNLKLFDFYGPYQVSMEILKDNESLFRLTFFFRIYRPMSRYAYWHVMPSITLRKGNMEMSGLEKRYTDLDKELPLITGADIFHVVKSLIRTYGGV